MFFADVITTLMNGSLIQYLEVNPLYRLTETLFAPILANIFILGVFILLYCRSGSKPGLRFTVINAMIVTILARSYAIKNAIYWLQTPLTEVQAASYATPEVITETIDQIVLLISLPLIVSLLTYAFWQLDHKVERVN